MRNRLYITFGLIAFAAFNFAPCAAQTQSSCSPEQRKEFILTATDKDGYLIDKLRAEHLSLKVGGSPATIADVVFPNGQPLDLAVFIDASLSQESVLPTSKAAARAFVRFVATGGQDRVAVVSFAEKADYLQVLTSDLDAALAAIEQIKFESPAGYVGGGIVVSQTPPKTGPRPGSTSLWDVIRSATDELFQAQDKNRRRVVLLFSDGKDTSSSSELNPAIEAAIKHNLAVFSIGSTDTQRFVVDEQPLKKLSEQTGGIARFPGKKMEKLEAALNEIARQLRSSYVVGYCGGDVKDKARLQVEVIDPEMKKAKPVLVYKRY